MSVVYAYRCEDCGADFNGIYDMGTAPDKLDCCVMACDGIARRIITAPAVHITGGTQAGYVKR